MHSTEVSNFKNYGPVEYTTGKQAESDPLKDGDQSTLSDVHTKDATTLVPALKNDTFQNAKDPSIKKNVHFDRIEIPEDAKESFDVLIDKARTLVKQEQLYEAGPYFMEAYHEAIKFEDIDLKFETILKLASELAELNYGRFDSNALKILEETSKIIDNQLDPSKEDQAALSTKEKSVLNDIKNKYNDLENFIENRQFDQIDEAVTAAMNYAASISDDLDRMKENFSIAKELIHSEYDYFNNKGLTLISNIINYLQSSDHAMELDGIDFCNNILDFLNEKIDSQNPSILTGTKDLHNQLKDIVDTNKFHSRYESTQKMENDIHKVRAYCELAADIMQLENEDFRDSASMLLEEIQEIVDNKENNFPQSRVSTTMINAYQKKIGDNK